MADDLTPGQAARKAWKDAWDAAPQAGRGTPKWDSLAYEEACWERAAEAASAAENAGLRAKVAQLRKELAEFADSAADLRKRFEAILRERDQLAREVSLTALAQLGWQQALREDTGLLTPADLRRMADGSQP